MELSTLIDYATRVTTISIVNLSLAMLTVLIGFVTYVRSKKDDMNQLFLAMALSMGFWTFSSTMADVIREEDIALFWARMAAAGPMLFSAFFLLFTYFFPEKSRDLRPWKTSSTIAAAILGLAFVGTDWNIAEVRLEDWGTDFTPGLLYVYLFAFLLAAIVIGAKRLVAAYRRALTRVVKTQLIFTFAGLATVAISGALTNLVLPVVFGYTQATVIGPAASLFFVVMITYAIARHGLMNVKVIAAEFFSGIIVFLTFIDIFSADSVGNFAYKASVLAISGLIAMLLVRSVNDEVRRREELKILSDQLAEANKHLKEMDQLKSEFISIASHQLRTPISVVKGYLSLMIDGAYGQLNDALKSKAEQMYEMNERLVLMVGNMLNVTRIEKHKLEFTCAMTDVARVVGQAVEEMALKARQKGLEVIFENAPQEPLAAYVDKEKVHETLTNLLDNAIKYSQKGRIAVRAEMHRKGSEVLVSVKDTGVGMTKDEAARLFAKFFRAGAGKITQEQGTGLGLYVCKMFIEGMGGKIWIDRTAPGEGTTFAFVLPTEPKQECLDPKRKPVVRA